jgi:hypothetical protein
MSDEEFEAAIAARVLADFDVVARRRGTGAHLAALVARLADSVWPGAPLWKPACVLGLSLAIGLGVGALLPFYGASDETSVDVSQGVESGGDLQ